jgi:hypothetical protein
MKFLKPLLVSFSLLALAAVPAHAADDKKSDAKAGAGATKSRSFTSLDTNKDGSIARAEVAAHADLAAKFKDADKNADGKLSRSEYDAMAKPQGAGAGASMKQEKGDKKAK